MLQEILLTNNFIVNDWMEVRAYFCSVGGRGPEDHKHTQNGFHDQFFAYVPKDHKCPPSTLVLPLNPNPVDDRFIIQYKC